MSKNRAVATWRQSTSQGKRIEKNLSHCNSGLERITAPAEQVDPQSSRSRLDGDVRALLGVVHSETRNISTALVHGTGPRSPRGRWREQSALVCTAPQAVDHEHASNPSLNRSGVHRHRAFRP